MSRDLILFVIAAGVCYVVTQLLAWTSFKKTRLFSQLVRLLRGIPTAGMLSCNGNVVTIATAGDAGQRRDVHLWSGIFVWKGGERTVGQVLPAVQKKLRQRWAIWLAFVLPLISASIYFAATANPAFGAIALVAVVEQFFPFAIGPDLFGVAQDAL